MKKHASSHLILGFALGLAVAFGAGSITARRAAAAEEAKAAGKVYELRTYTTPPGGLPALHKRFREHTIAIFERHGMKNIGYWTPSEGPEAENTLIYILQHDSRETAKKSWMAFGADPEWNKAKKESETAAGGSLTTKVESKFLTPTDFSALK